MTVTFKIDLWTAFLKGFWMTAAYKADLWTVYLNFKRMDLDLL